MDRDIDPVPSGRVRRARFPGGRARAHGRTMPAEPGRSPVRRRTPIVEARGTVLTGWEGGLRIGVSSARSQVHDPRRRRQTPSRVPSTRQGRIRGHRTRAPCRDGRGFFRWWIFSPSPTSYPPPIRRASGIALVASCAVGAYRCRRGPAGPRDHDGAPWGGRASRDRAIPGRFRRSQAPRALAAGSASSGQKIRGVSELWALLIAGRHRSDQGAYVIVGGRVAEK